MIRRKTIWEHKDHSLALKQKTIRAMYEKHVHIEKFKLKLGVSTN